MLIARRGDDEAMTRALERAATAEPTWIDHDTALPPPGFHSEIYRRHIGNGDAAFAAAVEKVMTWQLQRGSGLLVQAGADRAAVGVDVVVGLPMGPAMVLAPCRVTTVFDSPERGGFRYVTLPGHPETGYEEFAVERATDGLVWLVVKPVSMPGSALVRLAGPVSRAVQARAGRRYLTALDHTAP
jgi:uncharacterized protein (UPF0548 family)